MWTETLKYASAGIMVMALAACGTTSSTMGSSTSPIPVTSTTSTTSSASGYGVVQSIDTIPRQQASNMGLGTIAGAVVGGVLGNQVGSGRGRTAATVAGAAGGALAGNQMQRNMQGAGGSDQVYRVTVRMDNGSLQTIAMETTGGVQVGDRVRLDNGNIAEILR